MQALYGKPSVDHACNVNNEMQVSGKDKATSLPDIFLVDFNPCEVSLKTLLLLLIFHIFVKSALSGENQEKMSPSPSVRPSVCVLGSYDGVNSPENRPYWVTPRHSVPELADMTWGFRGCAYLQLHENWAPSPRRRLVLAYTYF